MKDDVIDLDAADDEANSAVAVPSRHGFLPIVTNWFDRVFVAIYVLVALELLWMRFVEQAIPLSVCHVLAVAVGVLIVWRG